MRIGIWTILAFFTFWITGCGSGGGSGDSTPTETVSGVAAIGAPIDGQVLLKDSSGAERGPVDTKADGSFSFDVTGLNAPYFLLVEGVGHSILPFQRVSPKGLNTPVTLRGVGFEAGIVNINPFTEMALFTATGIDPQELFENPSAENLQVFQQAVLTSLESIQEMLAPLLDEAGVEFGNPCSDRFVADGTALDGVLDMISVSVDPNLGMVELRDREMDQVVASWDVTPGTGGMRNRVRIEADVAQGMIRQFGLPIAAAGSDQSVQTGETITLNGAASSDPNGDVLEYNWSLVEKPADSQAQLSDTTAISPTFVADVAGQYVFGLVVSDGMRQSAQDTLTIIVSDNNAVPVASPGSNRDAATGTTVTLDGSSSSDADNDQLTYSWVMTAKPTDSHAGLTTADTATPSFIPDVDGNYEITLTVSDGLAQSQPVSIIVAAVSSTNSIDPGDSDLAAAMVNGKYFIDGFLTEDSLPGIYLFDGQAGIFENYVYQGEDSPTGYRGAWDMSNGYTTLDNDEVINVDMNTWESLGAFGVIWAGSLSSETESALTLTMSTTSGSIQKPFVKVATIAAADFRGRILSNTSNSFIFDESGNAGIYNGSGLFTWEIKDGKELVVNFESGPNSYFYFTAAGFNSPGNSDAAHLVKDVGVQSGSFGSWQIQ